MAHIDITLGKFLSLFVNSHCIQNMTFNIINTNNDSFPKKYRFSHETASTFWANIYKEGDPDNILEKYIDFIALMPNGLDPTKPLDYELIYNLEDGFLTPFVDEKSGKHGYKILPPVIYIRLKMEEEHSDKSE